MEVTNNKSEIYAWSDVISGSSTLMDYVVSHSNELKKQDRNGDTLLHYAAESDDLAVVKYLIEEKKMDVNVENYYEHQMPLVVAIRKNNENVAEYFIQHGAVVRYVDSKGNSLLHYAAPRSSTKILELVIPQGTGVYLRNRIGETPLHIAVENGNLEAVKFLVTKDASLVDANDEYQYTPLIDAVNVRNLNIVKYLVEHGADIQAKTEYQATPLHFAARAGYVDIVKYLTTNGADFNAQDYYSETPIHKAARKGETDILKHFTTQIGANLNLTDKYGNTVLHFAAGSGDLEMVKYLIEEKGFSVEAKNNKNETPLFNAAQTGGFKIVKYLKEEKNADINVRNNKSHGVLLFAVLGDDLEVFRYLVDELKYGIYEYKNNIAQLWSHLKPNIAKYLESREGLRNRRSLSFLQFGAIESNLNQNLITSDSIILKIGRSRNRNTIGHLSESHQPLGNSKSPFNVENFVFLGCIAEALNDSISKQYNFLRSNGVKVVPSNQIAVNRAREEFDQFVEKKIKNLSGAQQKEIRDELEIIADEINESLMRGVEFSGVHGLDDVLEMTKKCFCENLLPGKK